MQTQVMFYILNDEPNGSSFHHACYQAAAAYRNNQRVFIHTESVEQAHEIDELLWAFEPDSFVPHNIVGEGHASGSPVEISWQPPTSRRPILINLTSQVPSFAQRFATIIDFVPTDENLKQQARDRFRAYKQQGFQVDNQAVHKTQIDDDANSSHNLGNGPSNSSSNSPDSKSDNTTSTASE